MKNNESMLKVMDRVAVGITVIVLFIVGLMRRVKIPTEIDFSFLPPIHASVNVMAAICLIMAYYFIRKGQVEKHRKSIYGALAFSALFLLSYVIYHFTTEETTFCKEGTIRTIYFILLISHIILAGLILPFIMLAFNRPFRVGDIAGVDMFQPCLKRLSPSSAQGTRTSSRYREVAGSWSTRGSTRAQGACEPR